MGAFFGGVEVGAFGVGAEEGGAVGEGAWVEEGEDLGGERGVVSKVCSNVVVVSWMGVGKRRERG